MIEQNSPHRLGRRVKEAAPAVPVLLRLASHQPHLGLVDQRRRLQRLPRLLMGDLRRRQFPKFLIHQRQKLLRRRRVA